MAIFKCKMCGGALEIQDGSSVAVCSFCGTKQTIPKLDNETRINLYDRANHFRRNNDYDKAMSIYEQLLDADKTDAEAYWSILLCKYGVEYVEDPQTHRMMPTINRAQYTSIFADEDYKSAIQYADGYQREVYENEAKELDEIQKGILAISQKEEPFDIFICYKETDSYGRRTQDSVLAQDLYYQLTQEGYKVFFSRITLEDKLGTAYEPYIFAALNTAKIMVVIGTSKDNLNSVWVKNEWSRFLALTKKDCSKVLIPAYRDMDPYDLPDEFSHLQAQDMSKLGFMQDLIRGIKKILAKDEKIVVIPQNNATNSNGNVDALLKRAYIACEDGDFAKADSFAEKVLNINPELADAYIVKLLAECKVRKLDGLRTYSAVVKEKSNFQRAYKYAKSDLKSQLTAISKENIEYINYYPIYSKAKGYIENALYSDALVLLEKIPNYKDSATLIAQCKEKAESLKKENAYNHAISVGFARDADEAAMLKSIETLKSLNGYKDSSAQIDKLYARVDKYRYQRQVEVEKEEELNNQQKHRRKIGAIITTTCVIVLVAVLLMTFLLFVPLSNYNKAEDLVKNGDYKTAREKYKELDGFSDSNARVDALTTVIAAQEYFRSGYIMSGITELLSKIPSLTIHYNCSNGQISQEDESSTVTVEYKKGDTLKTPYRTGYDFSKWRIVEYSVIYDLTNISASLTLEAEWNKHEYSISYNMNGGVLAQKPSGYNYDSDDIKIGSPSREGYSFVGWSGAGIDGMVPEITIKHNSLGDMSFVANWQANTYTITFSDIYDTTINNTTQDVVFDSIVSLPIPTRVGYTFGGWYFGNDLCKDGVWKHADNITLTAYWIARTDIAFKVNHYLQNLGEGYTLKETDDLYGTADSNITPAVKVYSGFTSPEVKEVTILADGTLVVDYYYTRNRYTVNLVANNGKDVDSVSHLFESIVTLPTPQRDGYTFGGWFTDADLSEACVNYQMPSNDINVYAWWTEENKPTDFVFSGEGQYSISAYVGTQTEMMIPAYIGGIPVTSIGYRAFYDVTNITKASVPKTVESIGSGAFSSEANITEITIPFIGPKVDGGYHFGYIFAGSKGTSMNISGNTYIIPSTLKKVTVTKQTFVPKNAFAECVNFEEIVLPTNITSIGESAFYNCSSLKHINIGNEVKSIGSYAFYGCSSLSRLNSEQDGVFNIPTDITIINYKTFDGCELIEEVTIGIGVEYIAENAFANCIKLRKFNSDKDNSIIIPDAVERIGRGAFSSEANITEITIPFIGPKVDGGYHFGYIFAGSKGTSMNISGNTYIIPSTLKKVTVTKQTFVPKNAFAECVNFEEIVLPTNITSIGESAFYNCSSLKHINIGNEVKSIGSYAFYGCSSLSRLNSEQDGVFNIPTDITIINYKTFDGCELLKEVTIGIGVEYVAENAFANCVKLRKFNSDKDNSITIPDTVERIGRGAFPSEASITEITIPFIGPKVDGGYHFGYIFAGSKGTSMNISGNTYIIPSTLKKVTVTKQTFVPKNAFAECANFEEIVLPTNITSIGESAFYHCSSLKHINIGNEVKSIDRYAFYGCSGLTDIEVPQNTEIKDYAFDETGIVKSKNGVIYIGGTLYKYNGTMPQNYTLNINEGTVVVNKYAFQGCSGLTNIIFPNSLKRIETNAFKDCTSLAELTIPNSLQQIGYQAFYGCNALTSVSIPFVGYELNSNEYFNVIFGNVPTKLVNVKITGGISRISANAFSGCGNIKSVVLPDTVESIGENAFKGCAALNSINIPDNVTEIGQYAFYGCSSLVDVTLPNKLTKLPSYCFYGCTKLETVQLPSRLEEIGQYAFQNCSSLKSIIIPSEVKIIGSHAFGGCTSLTTVTFNGEKLENIGSYAFQGCSTLSEIIISASVVMVGEYAFSECPNLVIKYKGLSIPTTWDYNWNVDENTVEYV